VASFFFSFFLVCTTHTDTQLLLTLGGLATLCGLTTLTTLVPVSSLTTLVPVSSLALIFAPKLAALVAFLDLGDLLPL